MIKGKQVESAIANFNLKFSAFKYRPISMKQQIHNHVMLRMSAITELNKSDIKKDEPTNIYLIFLSR